MKRKKVVTGSLLKCRHVETHVFHCEATEEILDKCQHTAAQQRLQPSLPRDVIRGNLWSMPTFRCRCALHETPIVKLSNCSFTRQTRCDRRSNVCNVLTNVAGVASCREKSPIAKLSTRLHASYWMIYNRHLGSHQEFLLVRVSILFDNWA